MKKRTLDVRHKTSLWNKNLSWWIKPHVDDSEDDKAVTWRRDGPIFVAPHPGFRASDDINPFPSFLGLGRQLLPVLTVCLQLSEPSLSDHLGSRHPWPAGVSPFCSLHSTGEKGQGQQVLRSQSSCYPELSWRECQGLRLGCAVTAVSLGGNWQGHLPYLSAQVTGWQTHDNTLPVEKIIYIG